MPSSSRITKQEMLEQKKSYVVYNGPTHLFFLNFKSRNQRGFLDFKQSVPFCKYF